MLISKASIHSYINHDKFPSVNNVLRQYNDIKTETKNPKTSVECTTYKKKWKPIVSGLMLLSNCAICGKKINFH